MDIELRSIDGLKPYENNPRKFDDTVVQAVANSIERFGFRQPIVIRQGEIIAGHVRLRAARLLGLAKVPVHVADDLTEEEARQYRLADNRLAELSRWDIGLLVGELKELAEPDDLLGFGFTEAEIEMSGIDEKDIMDGTAEEPWEEELDAPGRKVGPRVVIHFETEKHKARFLEWMEQKDCTIIKPGAKTTTLYVPAKEVPVQRFKREGEEEGGDTDQPEEADE